MSDTSNAALDASRPSVCVIIVAYNPGPYLARCIDALRRQRWTDFESIIVDNGSTDGAVQGLGALPANFRIMSTGRNLGFAAANNRGAAATDAPWIALLNPDAIAAPDWLERLMAAARTYPDVAMFGSTQIQLDDKTRWDGLGDVYHASGIVWRGGFGQPVTDPAPGGEVFSPCAAAALYRHEDFRAAGGFDERFFCYVEDIDLAFRLRLKGQRALQVADAVVHHAGSATTGRSSDFTLFHGWRNRSWVFVKNMPGPLFWPLLPLHLLALVLLLLLSLRPGSAVTTQPCWRGLKAAIAGLGPIWQSRQEIQRQRRVSLSMVARAFSWSPLALLGRRPVLRPVARGSGTRS
ncbi:glycosyltransferase family 2 protein [Hypericibacter sp.]|uniref:glycosyltransferase family 2 protein n=1 Tax=Hypericibacter sp. TaxID=2705401 RepID=UPI003D6D8048